MFLQNNKKLGRKRRVEMFLVNPPYHVCVIHPPIHLCNATERELGVSN